MYSSVFSNIIVYTTAAKFKHIVPTLYNQLKVQLNKTSQHSDDKPPAVYGLGSVYSASIVALTSVICLVLGLLLGDGIAPSLLLAITVMYLCMELYSASVTKQDYGKNNLFISHHYWMSCVDREVYNFLTCDSSLCDIKLRYWCPVSQALILHSLSLGWTVIFCIPSTVIWQYTMQPTVVKPIAVCGSSGKLQTRRPRFLT